jgi:undecaprenyl-diphosphatase
MLETLKLWDRKLFVFLNNLGIEQYDGFWIFITRIESWTFLFIGFIMLILHYHKVKRGLGIVMVTLIIFGITLLITNVTKVYVARLRPNNVEALSELIRALLRPTSYSFFSGHASSSFAITTFVVLSIRKFSRWIYLAYLWPVLFVLSRIYVGVHYPSDIVVGALVGFLMALAGYFASRKILQKI